MKRLAVALCFAAAAVAAAAQTTTAPELDATTFLQAATDAERVSPLVTMLPDARGPASARALWRTALAAMRDRRLSQAARHRVASRLMSAAVLSAGAPPEAMPLDAMTATDVDAIAQALA